MATNADTLKQLIITEFGNCGWDTEAATQVDCLAQAIAEAVTQHIKDAAETTTSDGHTHDVV